MIPPTRLDLSDLDPLAVLESALDEVASAALRGELTRRERRRARRMLESALGRLRP